MPSCSRGMTRWSSALTTRPDWLTRLCSPAADSKPLLPCGDTHARSLPCSRAPYAPKPTSELGLEDPTVEVGLDRMDRGPRDIALERWQPLDGHRHRSSWKPLPGERGAYLLSPTISRPCLSCPTAVLVSLPSQNSTPKSVNAVAGCGSSILPDVTHN